MHCRCGVELQIDDYKFRGKCPVCDEPITIRKRRPDTTRMQREVEGRTVRGTQQAVEDQLEPDAVTLTAEAMREVLRRQNEPPHPSYEEQLRQLRERERRLLDNRQTAHQMRDENAIQIINRDIERVQRTMRELRERIQHDRERRAREEAERIERTRMTVSPGEHARRVLAWEITRRNRTRSLHELRERAERILGRPLPPDIAQEEINRRYNDIIDEFTGTSDTTTEGDNGQG